MIETLHGEDRNVQQGIVDALGRRRVVKAIPHLRNLLFDERTSWHTKCLVVKTLRQIGNSEGRSVLERFDERIDELIQILGSGERNLELELLYEYIRIRDMGFLLSPSSFEDSMPQMMAGLHQLRSTSQVMHSRETDRTRP